MFKKDEYIVLLDKLSKAFDKDYCYKQRENYEYLRVYKDANGDVNGNFSVRPIDKGLKKKWRYATSAEIAQYDKLGKPYDVTTLNSVKTLNKDTVKIGQKVRVCNLKENQIDDWNNANLPNNYTGTVTSVRGGITSQSPNHFWVYLDNNTLAIGTMHLELLEEPNSETLSPETMVSGEWYKVVSILDNEYLFKFDKLHFSQITAFETYLINKSEKISQTNLMDTSYVKALQKASKEEVEKYYPDEFKKTSSEPFKLVKDKYYYTWNNDSTFSIIFKVVNPVGGSCRNSKRCIGTFITSTKEYRINSELSYHTINSDGKVTREYREATQSEIDWLDYCIKAGKYVPIEEATKESEVLVFGKFKIGSIVVSLTDYASRKIGDILQIVKETKNGLARSGVHSLVYTNSKIEPILSDKKDDFRQATDEEVKAFEQGITNINDMKPIPPTIIEEPINTYGLTVGDELPEKIICKWAGISNNYSLGTTWVKRSANFIGNRIIKSFKVINNIVSFEVSDTNTVYLKAEGFKEFMDNFDKPNFSSYIKGKWYTSASWMSGSYCKFDRVENGVFYFTEKYCNNYMNISGFWSLYPNIVEADMSEVSKFLPNGHSDKLPEIQNTNTMELPKEWCIKCTSENRDTLKKHPQLEKEYNFIPGNYYGFRGDFTSFNTEYSWGKELTLDEFKRLVLKEEVKSEQESLLEEAKRRYPIGTKYYVAHLSGKDAYYEDTVDNHDFSYSKHSITLEGSTFKNWVRCVYHEGKWADIVANTSEEFKVGDWVTIIANTNRSNNEVGDVGKITKKGTYRFTVTVEGRKNSSNWTEKSDMRLATPEEIAKAQGYKVIHTTIDVPKGFSPQRPSDNVPIDVILEYCKSVYKEGMEIIPVFSDGQSHGSKEIISSSIFKSNTSGVHIKDTIGYVYANGEYAKIVSLQHKVFEIPKGELLNFTYTSINEGELPIVKKSKKSSIIELELVQEKQTINLPIVKKQTIKN